MDEIDFDELVSSLEQIVGIFDEDITPYAIGLTQKLLEKFKQLMETANAVKDDEEDDGEAALAAIGCITAVKRVISSCYKSKETLRNLEAVCLPHFIYCLTPDGIDCVEDCVESIALLLYHQDSVSPQLWEFYPLLMGVLKGDSPDGGYAYEYLSYCIPAL